MNAGETGHEALIVTDEDEVLACGKNEFGCLGLGNDESQVKPVSIPELGKKKVKGKLFCVWKKLNRSLSDELMSTILCSINYCQGYVTYSLKKKIAVKIGKKRVS